MDVVLDLLCGFRKEIWIYLTDKIRLVKKPGFNHDEVFSRMIEIMPMPKSRLGTCS